MSGATCAIFITSFAPTANTSTCSATKFRCARITLTATRRSIDQKMIRSPEGPEGGGDENRSCLEFGTTPDQDQAILPSEQKRVWSILTTPSAVRFFLNGQSPTLSNGRAPRPIGNKQ